MEEPYFFLNKGNEIQGSKVTCVKSHSKFMVRRKETKNGKERKAHKTTVRSQKSSPKNWPGGAGRTGLALCLAPKMLLSAFGSRLRWPMLDFLFSNVPKGANQKTVKHPSALSAPPFYPHLLLSLQANVQWGGIRAHTWFICSCPSILQTQAMLFHHKPPPPQKKKKKILGYSTLEIQISVKMQRNIHSQKFFHRLLQH